MNYNTYASWYQSYKPYFIRWWEQVRSSVEMMFNRIDNNKIIRELFFYSLFIFILLYFIFSVISFFYKIPFLIIASIIIAYFLINNK
jgi:hypothetical protein